MIGERFRPNQALIFVKYTKIFILETIYHDEKLDRKF